jgi:hypothetical protein
MKTFRISYVYEGESQEFSQLLNATTQRDAEASFNRGLMDVSEDCPEKATITQITCLS